MDIQAPDLATELADELVDAGFGPFLSTPCGILARLHDAIDERTELMTVVREDNAVGIAAGAELAGRCPVVMMQNSGFAQSVNAIASLVLPYRLAMLFVISLRGVDPDSTQENLVMGRLTIPMLTGLGVEFRVLDGDPRYIASWAHKVVADEQRPAAVLVPPTAFGWRP
jgi:sulfopyruvate decarboxylase subunit alpha/phosphonopyruvate decarboxylase